MLRVLETWPADKNGDEPVRRWMKEDLSPPQRRALGFAMQHYLSENGVGVCSSEFGKALGGGLYEFRLRYDLKTLAKRLDLPYKPTAGGGDDGKLLLRVFFGSVEGSLILLLGGYDKWAIPLAPGGRGFSPDCAELGPTYFSHGPIA